MPAKIAAIETKLARLLPWVDPRAEYAWTGNFGGSRTGTPSIRGMTAGTGDADSDLFSFTRRF